MSLTEYLKKPTLKTLSEASRLCQYKHIVVSRVTAWTHLANDSPAPFEGLLLLQYTCWQFSFWIRINENELSLCCFFVHFYRHSSVHLSKILAFKMWTLGPILFYLIHTTSTQLYVRIFILIHVRITYMWWRSLLQCFEKIIHWLLYSIAIHRHSFTPQVFIQILFWVLGMQQDRQNPSPHHPTSYWKRQTNK